MNTAVSETHWVIARMLQRLTREEQAQLKAQLQVAMGGTVSDTMAHRMMQVAWRFLSTLPELEGTCSPTSS